MEDRASKTEEPTPKRLRDAKRKGQVAKSGDLNAAVSFFVFTILIGVLGQYIYTMGLKYMENSITRDYTINISRLNGRVIFINHIIQFGLFLAPFFAVAILIGIGSNLIQTGFLFTLDVIKPNVKRLNPIEGFKNIFSKKALFNLLKNIFKLVLVLYLSYRNLKTSVQYIINSGSVGSEKLFGLFIEFIKEIGMSIGIVLLILGIVDYIIERREHRKNLRMSKQEIKDELKEMEGNPEIKSLRQQRQRQLAMSRMMSNIEDSTVVVTNPNHIAIALRYDSEIDKAPLLTAKGIDFVAGKIKDKAKEYNVPIMENKPLARAIYSEVEIGDHIPVEFYQVVAEILALVHQMEGNKIL